MRTTAATQSLLLLLPGLAGLAGAQLALRDGHGGGDGDGDGGKARYGAVPLTPEGMMPRFVADRVLPQLARRDGNCGAGFHNCLDVGFAGSCCENTHYCYVNKQSQPRCCPIGSNCVSDSNCSSDRFQCTSTATVAVTVTVTATASSTNTNTDAAVVTVFTTASAQVGCCGRACPQTSQYLCPKDLGGACCSFGFDCRSGGQCVETKKPSGPSSGTLTPVVDGCTTSQFKCPDGAGCCDEWMHCTRVDDKPYCAPGNPTNTNVRLVGDAGSGDSASDSRLSGGAKAGIGVGVAVAGGLALGAAAWWFCVRRRRRRGADAAAAAGASRKDEQPDDADADAGVYAGSNVPRDAAHRPIGIGEMSETTASQAPRPTDDYFGPVPGPYTDASDAGRSTASPSRPQHAPENRAVPVEIDSSTATPAPPAPATPTPSTQHLSAHPFPHPDTTDGRFELYGCEAPPPVQPSPSLRTTTTTPGTPASERPRKADR
ncbi:hypothetical protein JDV02_006828 [Purpureocillium takamizusanense]|uniref:Uncharacterized protein n=1 Tax=Purpureocillium takamizusanense TaxID=2060973 RepID=A0A9Q8QH25_9HYPO|nr:uncharacterized protein JDV02_006828 [Purpureocillium takamizusanense]UNI20769.1 hypothetical protein JDV02_006828 [Purpureocillium takamizusanense]